MDQQPYGPVRVNKSAIVRGLVIAVFIILFFLALGWLLQNGWWKGGSGDDDDQSSLQTNVPEGFDDSSVSQKTLTVNSKFLAKGGFFLSPSTQPTNPQAGQIFYSNQNNTLQYYNGTEFVELTEGVTSVGGASGAIVVGNGLTVVDGVLSSTVTGGTNYIAGTGMSINGATLNNTGVISVNGTSDQVNVNTNNGTVTLSLPQSIALNSTPTFAGINLGSPLSVSNGGTGTTSLTPNGVLLGNGTSPITGVTSAVPGECLISTAGAPVFQSCPGGGGAPTTATYLLVTNDPTLTADRALTAGSNISFTDGGANSSFTISVVANPSFNTLSLSTPLAVSSGGTGANSLTANGILMGNGAGAISAITSGGPGLCLVSTGGAPSFQVCPGSGGVSSVNSLTGALTIQGTTNQVNVASVGSTITLSTPQDIATTSSPTFAGLTLTNPLTVPNGGTGANSHTAGGILFGNGVGAFTNSGVLTNGQLLIGDGSGAPTAATLTQGSGIAITNGAGSILVDVDGTVCRTSGNCAGVGGVGDVLQGGNSFTTTMTLGTNDAFDLNLETSGLARLTISSGGDVTIANNASVNGNTTLGNAVTDNITLTGAIQGANALIFDGATNDANEIIFAITDPGADFTITVPAATGTLCLTTGNCAGVGGTGDILNNGQAGTVRVGTNDATSTMLETNNVDRLTIDSTGSATFSGALNVTGLTTLNGNLTVQTGDVFTFNGDAFTDLTGTGLIISTGSLQTTLGTTVDLTSEVTGILPIANGGTGASTAQGAINNISGLTTNGDILYHNGTNVTRLPRGANGQCLLSDTTTILWTTCTGDGSGATTVGALDGGVANANGATITGTTLFLQSASASFAGLVNTTTQTFAGDKTFTGNVTAGGNILPSSNFGSNIGADASRIDTIFTDSLHLGFTTGDEGYISYNSVADILNFISTGNISVGTSDTTGTLFVLDTKTDSGDPAGVNGGMYYNSNTSKLRCYEGGAWKDCISTGDGSGATTVGALDGGVANANGATITGTTLFLQSASATMPGLVSTTAQTFAGVKTFANNVIVQGGTLTVGTTAQGGTLVVSDGSSNTATIAAAATAGNFTVSIPAMTANDSFCLLGLNNCPGNSKWTDSGTLTYLTATTDSVGIGTSTDLGAKLQVVNTSDQEAVLIRANASQTNANPLIVAQDSTGANELFRLHAPDNTSIFLGSQAGINDDGNNNNVGVGLNALFANTSGTENLAFGQRALMANTTGSWNTAIGSGALISNTTGGANSAFGEDSLAGNTTGTLNVGVGNNTLQANTTGNRNTAIGQGALSTNAGGSWNVAIGTGALEGGASGSANTAVGENSLQANIGDFNTAVGNSSLMVNTSGSNNVSIGMRSLSVNTTGSNNIALGYQAGDNITTGSNNLIIGHDIDAASATGSNQLNIAGILTSSNYLTGNLVVGTSDTTGQLLVLDNKTDAGDPAGVDGGMYYNSSSDRFRCFEAGAWKDCAVSTGEVLQDGNSFFTDMTIGTNDTFSLNLETDGVTRFTIDTAGDATFNEDLTVLGSTLWVGPGTGGAAIALGPAPTGSSVVDFNNLSGTDHIQFDNNTDLFTWKAGGVDAFTLSGSLATALQGFTVNGNTNLNGNTTIGNANTDLLTVTAVIQGANPLVFEGATANAFETTLAVADPTADNTITLPNASGTVCLSSGNCPSTSLFTDGGVATYLTATGDALVVGSTSQVLGAKLAVVGTSNQTQLLVRANATQTQPLVLFEDSSGNEMARLVVSNGNIGLGYLSLANIGAGSNNISLGNQSMAFAAGDSNIALGENALRDVTSDGNIGIGSGALRNITTGDGNTAVGFETGNQAASGSSDNALFGYRALYTNSGSGNAIFGAGAVGNLNFVTSNNNSVFGTNAGAALSTADGNILLGYQAGDNITTGDNNIIIGYDINAASATGSNQLNIAGILTSSDYLTGNLVVGTSDTTGQLLVLDNKTDAGDPTGVNGGMYYNSNTSKFRCYEGGIWKDCIASGSTTLQGAYDAGNTVTTTANRNVAFNLTGDGFSTDTSFIVDIQSISSTFLVQTGGADVLHVNAARGILYRGANGGQFQMISDLNAGARSNNLVVISQTNSVTNDNTAGLLQLNNFDTGSTSALLQITQNATSGTGLSIGGVTSGTGISITSITSGTAISLSSTAGNGVVATGLTGGIGLNVGSAGNLTSGVGVLFHTVSGTMTTASALRATGIASGTLSGYTGQLVQITPTRIHTGATVITDTGNYLAINRQNTMNNAGGVFNVVGDLVNLQSSCTQTAGTCTDSASILSMHQSYANASGAILDVTGAGTGNQASFDASNASANGVSIDIQSSSNAQYALRVTSNNGATTGLSVLGNGTIQIAALPAGDNNTQVCRSNAGLLATCTSSSRFKSDITSLSMGLEQLHQINPVSYTWTASGRQDIGFIAEQVAAIIPQSVTYDANGEVASFNPATVTALLVSSMKELDLKVQDIDMRLTRIEQGIFDGSVQIAGGLKVSGTTEVATLKVNGKIITAGNAPTITAVSGTASISGNDTAGTVSYSAGSSATGNQVAIVFSSAYSAQPRVTLTPVNAGAASVRFFVDRTATGFTISFIDPPTSGTVYTFDYQILQ